VYAAVTNAYTEPVRDTHTNGNSDANYIADAGSNAI
jgi:hypothetical protein